MREKMAVSRSFSRDKRWRYDTRRRAAWVRWLKRMAHRKVRRMAKQGRVCGYGATGWDVI